MVCAFGRGSGQNRLWVCYFSSMIMQQKIPGNVKICYTYMYIYVYIYSYSFMREGQGEGEVRRGGEMILCGQKTINCLGKSIL